MQQYLVGLASTFAATKAVRALVSSIHSQDGRRMALANVDWESTNSLDGGSPRDDLTSPKQVDVLGQLWASERKLDVSLRELFDELA
eukprot:CAMPEP_0184490916 /NCGR_PEP_ID=MMETSP0113_2-20130426/19204_1 /TAXON_ID=91329 /ORGANISM="Norrisiella sphaerica, Strain BC52" /LENGTH=86 /DNA_ID=CAMNT_0026875043 /DNA_START=90 /DNA_END=347 /DNA_ORIENTATION=+